MKKLLTTICWAVGAKAAKVDLVTENEVYLQGVGKFADESYNLYLTRPKEMREVVEVLTGWVNKVSMWETLKTVRNTK